MAKYCGIIGFSKTEETSPGIWEEVITERTYFGDLIRNAHRFQNSENLNDNINVSNEISIVADPYAFEYFFSIKYATFMGSKWKVTNVDIQHPRIILSIGGLYNAN